jgi:DNA-binding NarL/FixJ family response regulator
MQKLSRRLHQTLTALLQGDSEKQVALHLGLSRHTIHAYVKGLYRHFGVNSRGELLARFVAGGANTSV